MAHLREENMGEISAVYIDTASKCCLREVEISLHFIVPVDSLSQVQIEL